MEKRVGKALGESSCLFFDQDAVNELNETPDLYERRNTEILEKYKLEADFNPITYLESIQDTEAINEVALTMRETLEATCAEGIEAEGLNAADIAEEFVFEGL